MKSTIEIPQEVRDTPQTHAWPVSVEALERLMTAQAPVRPIFSDSLLRYEGQKSRQTWATFSSIVFQCLVIGLLLLLPLYFTQELPKSQLLTFLVAPPPPPPPPPAAAQVVKITKQVQTDLLAGGALRTPTRIPQKVQMIKESDAPPPMPGGGVVGGVPGGIPGGQLGGVIGGIVSSTSTLPIVPKFQPVVPQRVRVSQGVTTGLLLHKVQPEYPILARSARIQGEVVLKAIIDRAGNIQDLQLVSGHPMLVPAAIAAVKEWRYRPYLLNGQPVEVESNVTVTFLLSN
jgi:periplasmic protein TonB